MSPRRSSTAERNDGAVHRDAHRDAYGVEPICAVLPIAPPGYDDSKSPERDPRREPRGVQHDAWLSEQIGWV